MRYDKDSFLAGYAVGRQVKGWCYAPGSGGEIVIKISNIFAGIAVEPDLSHGVLDTSRFWAGRALEPDMDSGGMPETEG